MGRTDGHEKGRATLSLRQCEIGDRVPGVDAISRKTDAKIPPIHVYFYHTKCGQLHCGLVGLYLTWPRRPKFGRDEKSNSLSSDMQSRGLSSAWHTFLASN